MPEKKKKVQNPDIPTDQELEASRREEQRKLRRALLEDIPMGERRGEGMIGLLDKAGRGAMPDRRDIANYLQQTEARSKPLQRRRSRS